MKRNSRNAPSPVGIYFAGHTPHRPYIDAVSLDCPECGGEMKRIPDVGNPWLDAGIVPFSTLRYRSDPEYWREWYPADWISEVLPRPIPQLVLQPAGHGHGNGGPTTLHGGVHLRHAAG